MHLNPVGTEGKQRDNGENTGDDDTFFFMVFTALKNIHLTCSYPWKCMLIILKGQSQSSPK